MDRFAVISDIHGNLPALEAVAADIAHRGISDVVNLGDHISGPLWPAETLVFLMRQPWTHIAGNHDRQLVGQPPEEHNASDRHAFAQLDAAGLAWLRALLASLRPEADMLLCHGSPDSDKVYLLESVAQGTLRLARPEEIRSRLGDSRALLTLCGHTHMPRIVRLEDRLLINPGSVGLPAYEGHKPELHVFEMGSPEARYAVLERQDDGWHVEFIALPYDHMRAARQAHQNDRPEWEAALASGYLRP